MRAKCVFAILILLALCSSASATTYYLDAQNGNDTTGDGSSAVPWKTIAKALSVATSGDTVILASGTYDAFIDEKPDRSGWLTFQAADGAKPELPYIKIGSTGWNKNAYLLLKGLQVISNQANTGSNRIFLATDVGYVKLQDCYLYGYKRYLSIGVLLENVNNVTLEHCEVFYNVDSSEYFPTAKSPGELPGKTRGVELGGSNITIQSCYIHDMASSGIEVASASTNVLIQDTHVTNQHSGWPGWVSGDGVHGSGIALLSGNVTINRCIVRGFGNTRLIGIYAGSGEAKNNIVIENSLFYDISSTPGWGFATGGIIGSGCKFNHNTMITFWQSATPPSNCERYKTAIALQWAENYSGDFEFYNNLIIGKVTNSITASSDWYDGQYYALGKKVSNSSGSYFRCKINHTAVTADNKPDSGTNWNAYWEPISAAYVNWVDGTHYDVGEIINSDSHVFRCISEHDAATATNKPPSGLNWATYWEYVPGRIWDASNNIVFSYLYPGFHTLYDLHYDRLTDSTVLCSGDSGHAFGWKGTGWNPEADFFVADTPAEMLLPPPAGGCYYTTADFHLKANSPAINYGDIEKAIASGKSLGALGPEGFISDDGIARDATHHSAGAYEFQGATPQQPCTEAQLLDYISQWKQGNITMAALMQKIAAWKAGTGC